MQVRRVSRGAVEEHALLQVCLELLARLTFTVNRGIDETRGDGVHARQLRRGHVRWGASYQRRHLRCRV